MLSNSACCNNVVRLNDLLGQKLEVRQYQGYVPMIGAGWLCPNCDTKYFVSWHKIEKFWANVEDSKKDYVIDKLGNYQINDLKGKFSFYDYKGRLVDSGAYVLSLNLYDSLNEINDLSATQLVQYLVE